MSEERGVTEAAQSLMRYFHNEERRRVTQRAHNLGLATIDGTALNDALCALDYCRSVLTLSSRDNGATSDTALLYAVLVGWDDEALIEVADRHGWSPERCDMIVRHRKALVGLWGEEAIDG